MTRIKGAISVIVMVCVLLTISLALYPVMDNAVTNITANYSGAAGMVAIVKTLYWILIGATVVLAFVFGLTPIGRHRN